MAVPKKGSSHLGRLLGGNQDKRLGESRDNGRKGEIYKFCGSRGKTKSLAPGN